MWDHWVGVGGGGSGCSDFVLYGFMDIVSWVEGGGAGGIRLCLTSPLSGRLGSFCFFLTTQTVMPVKRKITITVRPITRIRISGDSGAIDSVPDNNNNNQNTYYMYQIWGGAPPISQR